MASKVIFNKVSPYIDTCDGQLVTGIEYEWFKLYWNNMASGTYTIECVEKSTGDFVEYVKGQTAAIGLGGVFFHENYYLNYKTISPVVQSSLAVSINSSKGLSSDLWNPLYDATLFVVFT